MPGFGDTALIALIALLLFGPKKLPVLARQLGKLMAEFRRASNEFRSQMEEELRIAEQTDRQKEVTALEAASANKISPPAETNMGPHTPPEAPNFATPQEGETSLYPATESAAAEEGRYPEMFETPESPASDALAPSESSAPVIPIASSGDLNMMPPETGLPIARSRNAANSDASLEPASTDPHPPATHIPTHEEDLETETLHG